MNWIKSTAVFFVALACWNQSLANQIPNADLDRRSDGKLAGWTFVGKEGSQGIAPDKENVNPSGVKISRVEDPAGSGRYFLRLETEGKKGDETVNVHSAPFNAPAGFTYEVSADYRATGLMYETADTRKSSSASIVIVCNGKDKALKTNNINVFTNAPDWTPFTKVSWMGAFYGHIVVPRETESVQIRAALRNMYAGNPVQIDFRNIAFLPRDFALPNPSFELAEADGSPSSWKPHGTAKCTIVTSPVHSGSKAIEVKDAPMGMFSGWSTIVPVRPDREYAFKGFGKSGAISPGTRIAGAALSLQFLDAQGQNVGEPIISKTANANGDWTALETLKSVPPKDAVTARLTAGMLFCEGSSWFDDLSIEMNPVGVTNVAKVLRPDPGPSSGIVYAKNLLKNGDVESGDGAAPAGWTYMGKSDMDWTPEQIAAFYGNGRPSFAVGRGKGEWSHGVTYSGRGALLDVAIDPPLSPRGQWYGREPVDGYWLSDPMDCAPGKAYMSAAWIRPGASIESSRHGPLEIRFFDTQGKPIPAAQQGGSMLNMYPPNEWNYWFSRIYVAPEKAATMRLRFGHELAADKGGWGATSADNLAVWELPPEAHIASGQSINVNNPLARQWFAEAHAKTKPPYLPSPAETSEYESVWGKVDNAVPGNVFNDPKVDVKVRFQLFNALGEERVVTIKGLRTDWKGNATAEFVSPRVTLPAYSQAPVEIVLSPVNNYGAFYLDCSVYEGDAKVGTCSGRYAVIPPLERKRTQENIWGVSHLIRGNVPLNKELGQVMKIAGFGVTWVRDYDEDPTSAAAMHEIEYYRALGMKVVLQVTPNFSKWEPKPESEFDPKPYYEYGRRIADQFKGLVVAYGNWGVEQANNRPKERPVFRPVKNGQHLTDREYDMIYMAIHDGIRSVDKETPILIGNIATDREANAIKRMYGDPVKGQFDGAIINAYYALVEVARNALAEFDKHGDTAKTIWQEEGSDQRSPNIGPGRRYGEWEGAANLVRSWVGVACKAHPRIRAVTQWGFVPRTRLEWVADRSMLDIGLQPRPQFVAHAIMADALADAEYKADHSNPAVSAFEFKRTDGTLLVAWAVAGERELNLQTSGNLTVTDIMGNQTTVAAEGGQATVKLGVSPVYISGPSSIAIVKRPESN